MNVSHGFIYVKPLLLTSTVGWCASVSLTAILLIIDLIIGLCSVVQVAYPAS